MVYVCVDDAGELDHHVVEGGADGAGADGVGIFAGPADVDGVRGGEGEEDGEDGELDPRAGTGG